MDKPIPNWLRYGLVFASVAFVANAVNLYLIDLTGYLVAAAAVYLVWKEGKP